MEAVPPKRRRIVRAIRPPSSTDSDTSNMVTPREEDENTSEFRANTDHEAQDDEEEVEDSNDEISEVDEDEDEDFEEDDLDSSDEDDEFIGSFDEDEDEDEDPMDDAAPIDLFRRMMMSRLAMGEDDSDDDQCYCIHCRTARERREEEDEEEEEEEEEVDDNAPRCAICFEPETYKRLLVVLPCCGNATVESESSTRFCKPCVHKYLDTKGVTLPYSSSSVVGECPRCKYLLIANKRSKDFLKQAATHEMLHYAFEKDDGRFRMLLVSMAWCYDRYLFHELLDLNGFSPNSDELVRQMVQWGLLHKKNADYRINDDVQRQLRTYCTNLLEASYESDSLTTVSFLGVGDRETSLRCQYLMAFTTCAAAGWNALMKFRLWRCLLIWNRGSTLLLAASPLLPQLTLWTHPRWDGKLAATLNVVLLYLVSKILVKAFWIALYIAAGIAVTNLVGLWMIAPPPRKWKRWLRYGSMLVAASSVLYYVAYPCLELVVTRF